MRVLVVDILCNSPFHDAPLVKALRQNGVEAELASPRFYLEPEYLDTFPRPSWILDLAVHFGRYRPVRLGARTLECAVNYARLLRSIEKGAYDVVHLQWIPLGERQSAFMKVLYSVCSRHATPLVFTAHNAVPHDTPHPNRTMIARNLALCDLVMTHSEHVATELRGLSVQTPMAVVPLGGTFSDIELPSRQEAAASLGLDGDPIVLFAGLIKSYKGLDLLEEAWPIVRRHFPRATLAVAGRATGEEAQAQMRRLSQVPGVVVSPGYLPVKRMVAFHAACDLVVFPYRAISQSGALMSAVGLGRPCVATPIPGFVEQASELTSILFASDVSPGAIADAVIGALRRRDSLLAQALADRRRLVESPVGWPAVARVTIRWYESVLAGRDARRL